MSDECCRVAEAGSSVCDLPAPGLDRPAYKSGFCPTCGERGKPVADQTVKSLLATSLRSVQPVVYYFCRTRDCPVVYFSADGQQQFTVRHVRERVYQKEPDSSSVLICYCFQYTVGALRAGSIAEREAIVSDIQAGIQAGQCACDLRNPQGNCCLGNVLNLGRALEAPVAEELK